MHILQKIYICAYVFVLASIENVSYKGRENSKKNKKIKKKKLKKKMSTKKCINKHSKFLKTELIFK